ncbi:MAG: hypothetical protein ACN6OP_28600, partial [Pseudomonadales bacterium]
ACVSTYARPASDVYDASCISLASQSLASPRAKADARGLDDSSLLWSGTSPNAIPQGVAPGPVTCVLAGIA